LTFILNEHGRPFKSAASFGGTFAIWCKQAGVKPAVGDDGKTRSYRIHGLRKRRHTNGGTWMHRAGNHGGEWPRHAGAGAKRGGGSKKMAEAAMAKRAAGSNQKPERQSHGNGSDNQVSDTKETKAMPNCVGSSGSQA
jgi:hypothetical protein